MVAYRVPIGQNARANTSVGLALIDLRDASLAFANDAIPVPSIGTVESLQILMQHHHRTNRLNRCLLAATDESASSASFPFGNTRRITAPQNFQLFGN